ncbi:Ribokinase [Rubripirellula lacrimiformis]|uniref:Ribokinase n=1 Tax=Rubripirellula lacrimiformis TaxID=1930273 RepID=A0A517N3W5_9BACT|nr:PfkB family carbohydrate kinase [Rubripirellula lacrimiformis]QDT01831.1 Ribokinase [Rubripirellula lacrimiformis]
MDTTHKRFTLFGIGVSVLDVVMVVDALPEEESVVRAERRRVSIGGPVAVAAATAAILGGRVGFADRLGSDVMSHALTAELAASGVDVSRIEIAADQTASVATVWVHASNGSRTIVFSPGGETPLAWNDKIAAAVADTTILHCNGRHLDVCLQAIPIAKQNNVLVSFDGGAHRYRDEVLPIVSQADILIVSHHFAAAHWARSQPPRQDQPPHHESVQPPSSDRLARLLMDDFGASLVGVTAGQQGSWFRTDDGDHWHQPAVKASSAIDTTGCGDTFHGAFLHGMAAGFPPRRCSELAAIVAARNAEGLGALGFDRRRLLDELDSIA